MITVEKMAAQGEVVFRRVDALPERVWPKPAQQPIVVAHSETGHHHVVDAPDAQLFDSVHPLICYLRFEGPYADVVHLRPFDTHETLRLVGEESGPTYFEVRSQREYSPRSQHWNPAGD